MSPRRVEGVGCVVAVRLLPGGGSEVALAVEHEFSRALLEGGALGRLVDVAFEPRPTVAGEPAPRYDADGEER